MIQTPMCSNLVRAFRPATTLAVGPSQDALTPQIPILYRALGALVPYIVGTGGVRAGRLFEIWTPDQAPKSEHQPVILTAFPNRKARA